MEEDCKVSLSSSSQQLLGSIAIGSSRGLKPTRRICNLRAVPLGDVAVFKYNLDTNMHLPLTQPGISNSENTSTTTLMALRIIFRYCGGRMLDN